MRPTPRPGRASRACSQRGAAGAGARRLSSLCCAAGSRGRLSGRKRAAASDWSSDDDDSPPPPVRRNHAKAKRGGGGSGGGGGGARAAALSGEDFDEDGVEVREGAGRQGLRRAAEGGRAPRPDAGCLPAGSQAPCSTAAETAPNPAQRTPCARGAHASQAARRPPARTKVPATNRTWHVPGVVPSLLGSASRPHPEARKRTRSCPWCAATSAAPSCWAASACCAPAPSARRGRRAGAS